MANDITLDERPHLTRVEVLRRDPNPAPGETSWVLSTPGLTDLLHLLHRAERGRLADEHGTVYAARVQVWLEPVDAVLVSEIGPGAATVGDVAVRDRLADRFEAQEATARATPTLGL